MQLERRITDNEAIPEKADEEDGNNNNEADD